MEIPKQARKCPHCLHFQSRLSLLLVYFPLLVGCILILGSLLVFQSLFDKGESYEQYKDQIVITESEVALGETKSGATAAVIGTIKNNSSIPWKEIHFHVDFFDATGKRTDVGEEQRYSSYLPPNDSSTFKVSFRREFPETAYVKHRVRVVTAKDARARW